MKNIVWKKPDGYFSITFLSDDLVKTQDSKTHANELKERGNIDASWIIEAIDIEDYSIYPSSPLSIKQQIFILEKSITSRRRDEAILGIDNGWLKKTRAQIDALRTQMG